MSSVAVFETSRTINIFAESFSFCCVNPGINEEKLKSDFLFLTIYVELEVCPSSSTNVHFCKKIEFSNVIFCEKRSQNYSKMQIGVWRRCKHHNSLDKSLEVQKRSNTTVQCCWVSDVKTKALTQTKSLLVAS